MLSTETLTQAQKTLQEKKSFESVLEKLVDEFETMKIEKLEVENFRGYWVLGDRVFN